MPGRFQNLNEAPRGTLTLPRGADPTAFVRMEDGRLGVKVEPEAFLDGSVYLRWEFRSKLALADMAGAPWSDKNPKASVRKHREQMRFLSHRERIKVLQGGSRLGKSVLGAIDLLIAFLTPFSKAAIVASMYEQVDAEWRYFDRGLKKLFMNHPGVFTHYVYKNTANYHAFGADAIWGASARGYSTSEGEGDVLMGKEFTHMVLGEGAKIPITIFDTKMWRGLNSALMNYDKTHRESGFLSIYTTADELNGVSSHLWDRALAATNHDTRKLAYGKVNFAESMFFRESDVLANPDYDKKAYEAAKKILTAEAFDEQFRGKRGLRSGRVYEEYKPALHKVDASKFDWRLLRRMRLFVGFDTGTSFAAILVGLDQDGIYWILGEACTTKKHIDIAAEKVKEMLVRTVGRAFDLETYEQVLHCIHGWKVDPASEVKIELRKALKLGGDEDGGNYVGPSLTLPTRFGGGKFLLNPTIDIMKGLFSSNKIRVLDNLPQWHEEVGKYQWAKKKAGPGMIVEQKPIEAHDHALDAARFALVPLGLAGPIRAAEQAAALISRLGPGSDPHHELHKWQAISKQRGLIPC